MNTHEFVFFAVVAIAVCEACDRGTPPAPVRPTDSEMVNTIKSEEQTIAVRGKIFRIGDTADDVFGKLKPLRSVRQDTTSWSAVTHIYDAEGGFALTFARKPNPGPYRLLRISTHPRETSTSMVDCIDFSVSLKRSQPKLNFIERGAVVNEAREIGECRDIH
jgi:hypothetical protein